MPFFRRQFNASLAAGVFQIQCKPRRRPPRDMQRSRRTQVTPTSPPAHAPPVAAIASKFAACGRAEPASGKSSPRARSPCSIGASDASEDAHTKRRALPEGERGVRPRGGKSRAGTGASKTRVHLAGDAAAGKHGRDLGPCAGRASSAAVPAPGGAGSAPPRGAAAAKACTPPLTPSLAPPLTSPTRPLRVAPTGHSHKLYPLVRCLQTAEVTPVVSPVVAPRVAPPCTHAGWDLPSVL